MHQTSSVFGENINNSTANTQKHWFELGVLFVALPILLSTPLNVFLKVAGALCALVYVGFLMRSYGLFNKVSLLSLGKMSGWKTILLRFIVFAVLSAMLVSYFLPEKLFVMPLEYTAMWLAISLFYSVVSVYPQEIIYRQFFYARYRNLIANEHGFVLLNAVLFCLAHLMFWNSLVLALTFAGGVLFSYTYSKSRSVMFTSIEHSLYGLWLFTIGAGEMLAFPMPTS